VKEDGMQGIKDFSRTDRPSGFAGSPAGFGGATPDAALGWLKAEGFASVINLRRATEEGVDIEASRAAAVAAGLEYVHLPFDVKNLDPQLYDKFLATVGDEANRPVYIHCNSATRVGALWMIARVLEDDWSVDRAHEECEAIAGHPADAVAFASHFIAARRKMRASD
jgi:uncharacterized protein (TIGR01244 family)